MTQTLKLGVLGIDHPHIFGMLRNMQAQGCVCEKWWTDNSPNEEANFTSAFPDIIKSATADDIINDDSIHMVLISAIPAERADLALRAMRAGKDVMVDKPGCTTLEQLEALRACVAETGRIWTVNFSERFEVPAVAKAEELVAAGAIGTVKQTMGMGPHRQGLNKRPWWYYERDQFGGILCDIGSHQIDQFLYFTGSTDARVAHALTENTTRPEHPNFQDFGEMNLVGDQGHGYIRVDWFTPDALPTWGDGRLFILGDEGTIELRKYTDLARSATGNHLFLVNGSRLEHIDCNGIELPYFPRLVADIRDRTETAVGQAPTFKTMELAITAQMIANKAQGEVV